MNAKRVFGNYGRQGVPMSVIARDIAKPPATVYSYLLYHGGIKPRQRSRRSGCLSLDERETISRGLASCKSLRRIGQELGRSPSTISREVARNGGPEKYRACHAEKAFLKRSRRPKLTLLSQDEGLSRVVTKLLGADWSPEQIAGWLLKRHSSDGKAMCVSHETIYKSLFIQARGVLRQELKKHLRTKRMFPSRQVPPGCRQRKHRRCDFYSRTLCTGGRQGPAWTLGEVYLLVGSSNSAIATMVERHSRFTVLCKVQDKRAERVRSVLDNPDAHAS